MKNRARRQTSFVVSLLSFAGGCADLLNADFDGKYLHDSAVSAAADATTSSAMDGTLGDASALDGARPADAGTKADAEGGSSGDVATDVEIDNAINDATHERFDIGDGDDSAGDSVDRPDANASDARDSSTLDATDDGPDANPDAGPPTLAGRFVALGAEPATSSKILVRGSLISNRSVSGRTARGITIEGQFQ